MRHFSYFLFENFDPDREAAHPGNPRRIINARADGVLSRVADSPPQGCSAARLRGEFGAEAVDRLIAAGVLRAREGRIVYDTPVFLAEDAAALRAFSASAAAPLADRLWEIRGDLLRTAEKTAKGFDPRVSLYHILCGMVFDGFFFDWLGERGGVAVSRPHSSGLDYLSVIYEDCPELEGFSNGLLCSYNRLTDGRTSLQSFGDAAGERFDFYRCFRLRERGPLEGRFALAGALLDRLPEGRERQCLLDGARALLQGGGCPKECLDLLELFGYTENGRICVPVFSRADEPVIARLAALVEEALYEEAARTLREVQGRLEITAARHGVPAGETANELYHILFGGINEELVRRGLTAAPPDRPGEGRYLQCIKW